jgi:hypothetical protein
MRSSPPARRARLIWPTIPKRSLPGLGRAAVELIRDNGSTRVCESFSVLAMPRLMEWLLWVAVPADHDRTSDLESDLGNLKHLAENSPAARM